MLSETKSRKARKSFLNTLFFFLLVTQICFGQQDFWQIQGSPYGKYIRCIAAGTSEDVFLAVNTSLFRSTNNGELWTMTDYNHSLIQAITIDNDGKIYGGTNGEGVFCSTDNGTTWYRINDGLMNSNVLSLTVTPSNGIFCGTDGGGVYNLINDTSWQYLGLANVSILSLALSPNGYLYAGTSGYSVYRSTDAGNEWSILFSGLGDDRTVYSLVTDSSGTIYAGTELGIFRSSNGGDMWYQTNNGLLDTVVNALAVTQSQVILAAAGQLMYVSFDAGYNWQPYDVFGAEPKCFAVSESGFIYSGTVLGIYRSEDNVTSWTRSNNGLTNGESIQSICFSTDGDLFTGLSTGVFHSSDNGVSWARTSLRDENVKDLLYTRANGFIFAGTEYGITRSTDGGVTWSDKSGYGYTHKVSFGADSCNNLYTGYSAQGWWSNYGAVLISTDFGENWNPTALNGPPVTAMDVKPSGAIIVARADSGIYLSTNQGEEWEAKGLNVYNINSVLLTNAGCMFAGTEDGILYRSCDNGVTWLDISSSSFRSINGMLLSSSGNIFLADSNGVFLSTDNGNTWTTINSGLVDTIICRLKIDHDGYLYAGSGNGFIYKSSQIISDIFVSTAETPQSFYLFQNYPNPFNPSTSIRFTIPQRTYVQLKVFDVLGCEVTSLINEEIEAGDHSINFQAGSLSSGVYIYQLKAGNYLDSKKMLLIR